MPRMRPAVIIFGCPSFKMGWRGSMIWIPRTDAELTSSSFRNRPRRARYFQTQQAVDFCVPRRSGREDLEQIERLPIDKIQLAKGKANETLYNRPGCRVRSFQLFHICASWQRGWLGQLKRERFRGLRWHGQQCYRLRRKWRGNVHQRNRFRHANEYWHGLRQPNQYRHELRLGHRHKYRAFRHHWFRQPVGHVRLANSEPLILLIGFQSNDLEAERCAVRSKITNSYIIEIVI
jgi:hypothetical protein